VNYIVTVTERYTILYGKLDMCMFIIQMLTRNSTIIIKDKILNEIINVLSLNKRMKKHSHEELYDKFYQHDISMRVDSKPIIITIIANTK
jgi:predicted nucleic-acid-binding protein